VQKQKTTTIKNEEKHDGSDKTITANVLVTAAGGIIAQGIIKSLKLANASDTSPVKYKIIAADLSAQAAGLYRCDSGILIPSASSSNYIDSIIDVSKEQNIDAIYVGSDEELVTVVNAKERIEHETDAKVLTNPIEVIFTARDKWKTFEFLNTNNLSCAASSLPEDNEKFIQEFGFPIVVKPREGYGSKYFYVVNNRDEMKYATSKIQKVGWNPLLQEYLKDDKGDRNCNSFSNTEFTSGITVDRFGKYIMSSISIQKIVKSGQTYKAFIDRFEDIRRSAEKVALKLGARGAINIQAKLKGGEPKIFEINPRFSATCPMRSAAGINEPDVIFRNVTLGEDIKIYEYQRLVCLRYWNEVYVQYATYENTHLTGRVGNTSNSNYNNNSFILNYF
jgi:carbamoyl-phosphate synthase large subunit